MAASSSIAGLVCAKAALVGSCHARPAITQAMLFLVPDFMKRLLGKSTEKPECYLSIIEFGQGFARIGYGFHDTGQLPIKTVSNAPDADQIARRGGIVFDLFPQRNNMVVDDAVRDVHPRAPYFFEQVLAREHASPIADESGQQFQLRVRCLQIPAFTPEFETHQVQMAAPKAVHFDACVATPRRRMARMRARNSRGLNGFVT